MRKTTTLIATLTLLFAAGQATAQVEEERQRAIEAIEAREAEVAERLQQAERRMAEAAAEIAELTSERLPELSRELAKRFEIFDSSRPRIGVTIGDSYSEEPVEGVHVTAVTPGSAADDVGLRAGDVLTAINGEALSADSSDAAVERLLDFMDGVENGDVLDVEYLRDGKVGSVQVEPRPMDMMAFDLRNFVMPGMPHDRAGHVDAHTKVFDFSWTRNAWGDMELVELNAGLGKYFGTSEGVLVVNAPKTDALKLEDGDVIQKIDGRTPTSVRHAIRILSSYQPGESVTLEIMRDKGRRTLVVEMPADRAG